MIAVKGKFTYRGVTFAIAQRQLNNIAREAIEATAAQHAAVNIPKRFTYHGLLSLGLPQRSPSYTRNKFRIYGHGRPNVLTGESEEAAKSPTITATATSKGARARIAINAPRLNFRNPRSPNNVHPAQDVRQIPQSEAGQLTEEMDRHIENELSKLAARQTARTISVGAFI